MRLFARPLPEPGDDRALPDDVAHHARVLRVATGDRVRLFDGSGVECDAELTDASGYRFRIGAHQTAAVRARKLTLVIAMPKGKKLDTIIRMVTELGVHAIALVISERTIARPDQERGEHRVERLQRIAEEAAAQSQQAHVPDIAAPRALLDVCRGAPADAWKIVLWEESKASLDAACFGASSELPDHVWLVIGPEGGLSRTEIDALAQLGFAQATLGPTVLRVDTAAAVGVSAVLDRLGLLCR